MFNGGIEDLGISHNPFIEMRYMNSSNKELHKEIIIYSY